MKRERVEAEKWKIEDVEIAVEAVVDRSELQKENLCSFLDERVLKILGWVI